MVECKIEKKKITEYLKGCYYTYNGEIATCNKCGAEVYIPEILDGNMEKLYSEYRKKNGILNKEEIKLIPEKYQISNENISLILGWKRETFARYYDGKTPSKRYFRYFGNNIKKSRGVPKNIRKKQKYIKRNRIHKKQRSSNGAYK